jgi:hypothetical protein
MTPRACLAGVDTAAGSIGETLPEKNHYAERPRGR